MADEPFNPLSKPSLAESIVQALLDRQDVPLPSPTRFVVDGLAKFDGAGIYAIYYFGRSEEHTSELQSPC